MANKHVGVMLMTYGSPTTLDDIPVYLKHVYGGSTASPEVLAEFRRRYGLIGGSPLLHITREQAAALQEELNKFYEDGTTYSVGAGMRFAPPFIADVTPEDAVHAPAIRGLILVPTYP